MSLITKSTRPDGLPESLATSNGSQPGGLSFFCRVCGAAFGMIAGLAVTIGFIVVLGLWMEVI